MQVNGTRVLNYADFVKGLDPKGNFAHRIVELVAKKVDVLDDMTVVEANNGDAIQTTVRTETPKPVWTTYYGGIPSNKGSKAKIKVSGGMMGTKITVAKLLYDAAKDKDAVLEDEIRANITGMKNELANALVYGLVSDNPLGINGLFKHYDKYGSTITNDVADDTDSAHYVFSALGVTGNSSDKTKLGSIALVGWSPNTITAFHPEGHGTGGIEKSDKRVVDIVDPDKDGDATYEAYLQYIYWKLGLAVRDYRYGGRICNIQRNLMLTDGYEKKYVELIDRLSSRVLDDDVKQCFYMDKLMWEKVCTLYSRITRGNAITFQHVEGRKEKRLFGIPVRIMDPMKVNEAEVPAFSA